MVPKKSLLIVFYVVLGAFAVPSHDQNSTDDDIKEMQSRIVFAVKNVTDQLRKEVAKMEKDANETMKTKQAELEKTVASLDETIKNEAFPKFAGAVAQAFVDVPQVFSDLNDVDEKPNSRRKQADDDKNILESLVGAVFRKISSIFNDDDDVVADAQKKD